MASGHFPYTVRPAFKFALAQTAYCDLEPLQLPHGALTDPKVSNAFPVLYCLKAHTVTMREIRLYCSFVCNYRHSNVRPF
jgi:hypothetical protein